MRLNTKRPALSLPVVAIVAFLSVAGVGAYLRVVSPAEATDGDAETADGVGTSARSTFSKDVPVPVEGARAVRDTLVLSVRAPGEAAPLRQAKLLAQVAGRVVRTAVRDGQPVPAGAVLVAIDPTEYRLEVTEAEAALEQARAQFREQTLFDDRIADGQVRAERERIARAKSGLDAAEVRLERANLELSKTQATSPFAGRAASVAVRPGESVRVGDPLVTVLQTDPIEVQVQVLEGEVGLLREGGVARVTFSAFPQTPFRGTVASINPEVEGESRTARVTVRVANPGGRVLPGMYAQVALAARRFPDRVLVPRSAILERDRRTMLFVFAPADSGSATGRAKWRYVTTGLQNDSLVEIVPNAETDSVMPGEVVLTGGQYTLIHDAKVRLVANAEAAGGRPN